MIKVVYKFPRVLKRWNVVSDDNADNCCLSIDGYDLPMRGRSSMIVFTKDLSQVYLKLGDDNMFHVPGGGWNPEEKPLDAAVRETKEEAHIVTTHVKYCGTRIEYYPDDLRDWVREHVSDPHDYWYGYYSVIFGSVYKKPFIGTVDKQDEDTFISSGNWYKVDDILNSESLYPEYHDAIVKYIKEF